MGNLIFICADVCLFFNTRNKNSTVEQALQKVSGFQKYPSTNVSAFSPQDSLVGGLAYLGHDSRCISSVMQTFR